MSRVVRTRWIGAVLRSRAALPHVAAGLAVVAALSCRAREPQPAKLELFGWERGIGLRSTAREPLSMFLWFYEWQLFDALEPGEFSEARYDWPHTVAEDQRSASIDAGMLKLDARVDGEAVELTLEVTNRTERAWPEHAAIIACFNPGPPASKAYEMGHHKSTYFVAAGGLERLPDRDMHFRSELRPGLEARHAELEFEFSKRWRSAERDDHGGLLVRTSQSGRWTAGVAWEDWLGVQAHNPWLCMHVATRVGPLEPGRSRTIRGRLVLVEGALEAGLERLRAPWPAAEKR
jgi:hypothetical protein